MLAQQPVPPYPPRTVFRRRQLGPKAAPRIGPQTLLHLKQPGTHRIGMHVVAGRAQVFDAYFAGIAQNAVGNRCPGQARNRTFYGLIPL